MKEEPLEPPAAGATYLIWLKFKDQMAWDLYKFSDVLSDVKVHTYWPNWIKHTSAAGMLWSLTLVSLVHVTPSHKTNQYLSGSSLLLGLGATTQNIQRTKSAHQTCFFCNSGYLWSLITVFWSCPRSWSGQTDQGRICGPNLLWSQTR